MRVRRRAKERRTPLSAALQMFFLTGNYEQAEEAAQASGEADGHGFRGLTDLYLAHGDAHEERWLEHREDLLAEWIAEHPGTRPAAWWKWDASEPRRCLEGAEWRLPIVNPGDWAWCWKENMGIPGFQEERRPAVLVESQASYLRRLHLLTAAERKALTQEDFEPEGVAPPDDEGTTVEASISERAKGD